MEDRLLLRQFGDTSVSAGASSSAVSAQGVTSGMLDEVAFISGVNSDGTLAFYSYAAWNPGTNPADYTGGYTYAMKWGAPTAGTAGGTILYYFDPASNWSSTEKQALASGLALWSAVANISFAETSSAGQAQITFARNNAGTASTDPTFSLSPGAGLTGGSVLVTLTSATVSIDTSATGFGPINGSFTTTGGYPVDTYLHEEGHAIGFGHAGPYNGDVNEATQQFGPFDSRLWSLMSYIEPNASSAKYFSQYTVTGTNWGHSADGYANDPTTWMPLDILAAERLYGLPVSTPLSGGQVFGFNTNISGAIEPYFDFTKNPAAVVTLWDMGTGNTLDVSGYGLPSNVNLNAGAFSSTNGETNNIAIAFNTAIDTVVLGPGNDFAQANDDGDTLIGGAGNDTLNGGAGNDTLNGGAGNDTLNGGGGTNTAVFSSVRAAYTVGSGSGTVVVSGPDGVDSLTNIQKLQFSDMTLTLGAPSRPGLTSVVWRNSSTGDFRDWVMSGGTVGTNLAPGGPPTNWKVIATGDFNGDGTPDILWENTADGDTRDWLMSASGISSSVVIGGVPSGWTLVGTGDFNGDGTTDALWRNNATSDLRIWTMQNGAIAGNTVLADPPSDWTVQATGDFNGDGTDDILWRNTTTGDTRIWTIVNDALSGNSAPGSPPLNWSIAAAGDFNGDGTTDLLWHDSVSGDVRDWLMQNDALSGNIDIGGTSYRVVASGNFNGDGTTDLMWESPTTGDVREWNMANGALLSQNVIGGLSSDWFAAVSAATHSGDPSVTPSDGLAPAQLAAGASLANPFARTAASQVFAATA